MGKPFDPYREWLGIPDGKPSTYYGLFGIKLFEGDTGIVAHAADCLRARVRSVRPGGHVAEWQAMLDDVAAGKSCLLNPDTKASYDARLRGWAIPPAAQPEAVASCIPGRDAKPRCAVTPDLPAGPNRWTGPRDPVSPLVMPAKCTVTDSRLATTPSISQNQDPTMSYPTTLLPTPFASYGQSPASGALPFPTPGGFVALPSSSPSVGFPLPETGAAASASSTTQVAEALVETPSVEAFREVVQTSGMPQRRISANRLMALALPLLLTVSLGSVGYMFFQEHQQREAEKSRLGEGASGGKGDKPNLVADESPHLPLSPSPPLSHTPGGPAQSRPSKIELAQVPGGALAAPKPAAPTDPQKQTALKKALADARAALASRDLAAAKKCIEEASKNAQSGDDQDAVTRMDNLTKWVTNFWELIGRRLALFRPADELEVGATRVIIVEANAEQLVIKAAGQNRRYSVATLPTPLVVALADQALAKDAQTKVIFASFLLVDPHADRQRARQLIAEAAQQGENAEPLLPELNSFANASSAAADNAGDVAKPTIDAEHVKQAESLIRQRFQEDYAAATTLVRKAGLARKLLATEPQAKDGPDARVAMFHLALELAVAAGKAELVIQAADRIAELGGGDALETKVTALEELAKSARGTSTHRDLALSALKLGPQAITLGRAAESGRLAQLAVASAKKAQNLLLMRQAKLLLQQAAEVENQGKK